jgi:hypothetical protein
MIFVKSSRIEKENNWWSGTKDDLNPLKRGRGRIVIVLAENLILRILMTRFT